MNIPMAMHVHTIENSNSACSYSRIPKCTKFMPNTPVRNDKGMNVAEKRVSVAIILFILVD
jgi:hypothetical protein